ncbi:MAG: hypothetical protein ACTS5I_10135 [Rhodanobacter sp.]
MNANSDDAILSALNHRAVFAKCIQGDVLAITLSAAVKLLKDTCNSEPVNWQVRHFFDSGYWSGWAQAPSEDEAKATVARYVKLGVPAEYRSLYTRAATVPQGVWLPIESAPTDGTRIMLGVFRKPDLRASDYYLLATWDGENSHPFVPNDWTHWQPLPTPPPAELGEGS